MPEIKVEAIAKRGTPEMGSIVGRQVYNFIKKYEGLGLDVTIATQSDSKSSRSHRYFCGVVCPCFLHAHFESGNISKAMFKSLSSNDCMEVVRHHFFKKDKIGQNTWTYHSFKIKEWGEEAWNVKVQSVIDTVQSTLGYTIPKSNVKHDRNLLKRLQESI